MPKLFENFKARCLQYGGWVVRWIAVINKFTLKCMLLVKKFQTSPFLEVVIFSFFFSGFWPFEELNFGILTIPEIEFGILVLGF